MDNAVWHWTWLVAITFFNFGKTVFSGFKLKNKWKKFKKGKSHYKVRVLNLNWFHISFSKITNTNPQICLISDAPCQFLCRKQELIKLKNPVTCGFYMMEVLTGHLPSSVVFVYILILHDNFGGFIGFWFYKTIYESDFSYALQCENIKNQGLQICWGEKRHQVMSHNQKANFILGPC